MHTIRDNCSLGAAGLAEGTNANTFQIANVLHYQIGGRAYRKAITDNIAFAAGSFSAFVAQSAQKLCAYFFHIDSAGAVTVQQSAQVANNQAVGYRAGAFEWPSEVEGLACIGALVVDTRNAATFTAGSTDLGAADVTDTFYNVALDYGRPISY